MKENFTKSCLEINVSRNSDNTISVEVGSDYSRSPRKSQLFVNEQGLSAQVEQFWKSIKTKKLLAMRVNFEEIDWYDDEVDVYETPIIKIERGLKRAKVTHRNHGSVPKDWGITAYFKFADTTTNTPILEVVESLLGNILSTDIKVEFCKKLKPFLRKEKSALSCYNSGEED